MTERKDENNAMIEVQVQGVRVRLFLYCAKYRYSIVSIFEFLSQRSCDNEVRARSEDLQMEGIRWNSRGAHANSLVIDQS